MPRGRKLKLTPQMIEDLSRHIRAGNFVSIVCDYLNISQSAYYEWLVIGKKDKERKIKSLYSELAEAIKKAEAEAEMRNVNIIQSAGITTWQAAAWWLERRYKSKWGQKEVVEHKGDVQINIKIEGV